MHDPLLDMTVVVEHRFGAPPAEVWSLLTDVPRMAGLSPEVAEVTWLDARTFAATNRRGGMEWQVTGHVLEAAAPTTFVWCVSDPERRSSTWRYDITPLESGSHVRQEFRHGPGMSMVRHVIEGGADPAETIGWRSRLLADDMSAVLAAADGILRGG